MSVEERLNKLGIQIPDVAVPVGAYVPGLKSGGYIYTSGQLCSRNGQLITGRLGEDLDVEQGAEAAKCAAVNCLAVAKALAGSLDQIKRVVKITCFVNSTANFTDQPKVANGASFLMRDVLGENGTHSRSAVGVASLPMDACCEVEAVFELVE